MGHPGAATPLLLYREAPPPVELSTARNPSSRRRARDSPFRRPCFHLWWDPLVILFFPCTYRIEPRPLGPLSCASASSPRHRQWQALRGFLPGHEKWHGRGCHRPRIITMLSVGQTVVSRAYFTCAGELSRRRQWRTAVPHIFSGRMPPLLLHLLIRVVHLGSNGLERPVPLRWQFS
jgi:hypothetical protein